MSGPVATTDEVAESSGEHAAPCDPGGVDLHPSRATEVGGVPVRRALPRRALRTLGAWCFLDHFGPVGADRADAMQVGAHPHIGLQTVTWLLEGEVLHTDSLGSEQPIRPGELNLMTAGAGVAHAEEARPGTGGLHGVQLWVAQPERTRHGAARFEHHAELPTVQLGPAVGTVLVGTMAGETSPARTDTPLLGLDLVVAGAGEVTVPLDTQHEHGLVVLDGAVGVGGTTVEPGTLAHLPDASPSVELTTAGAARALLLGGEPLDEDLRMWWNFVARTRDELDQARADWQAGSPRFGPVPTALPRLGAPRTPWTAS